MATNFNQDPPVRSGYIPEDDDQGDVSAGYVDDFKPPTTSPYSPHPKFASAEGTGLDLTPQNGRWTMAQQQEALRRGGWPEELIPKMSAIGWHEGAQGQVKANRVASAGENAQFGSAGAEDSVGPWQINWKAHSPWLTKEGITREDLFDPIKNAQVAYKLYQDKGFKPWKLASEKYHQQYLPAANKTYRESFGNLQQPTTVTAEPPDISAGYVDDPTMQDPPTSMQQPLPGMQEPTGSKGKTAPVMQQEPGSMQQTKPALQPDKNGRVVVPERPGVKVRPEQARQLGYTIAGDQPAAAQTQNDALVEQARQRQAERDGETRRAQARASMASVTPPITEKPYESDLSQAMADAHAHAARTAENNANRELVDSVYGRGIYDSSATTMTSEARAAMLQNAKYEAQARGMTEIVEQSAAAQARARQVQLRQQQITRTVAPTIQQDQATGTWQFDDPKTNQRVYRNTRKELNQELGRRGYGVKVSAARPGSTQAVAELTGRTPAQVAAQMDQLFVPPNEVKARAITNQELLRQGPGLAPATERIAERLRSQGLVSGREVKLPRLTDNDIAALERLMPLRADEREKLRQGQPITDVKPDTQAIHIARALVAQSRIQDLSRVEPGGELYEKAKQTVISRNGGQENIDRIKRDYAAVGRDATEVDKRVGEQIAAEAHRQEVAQMSPDDRRDIQRMTDSFIGDSRLYRWLDVGKQDFMQLAPNMATGIVHTLGDLTNNDSIRDLAGEMRKTVGKRMLASEMAKLDMSSPEKFATGTFEVVGSMFNVVGATALTGNPTTAMTTMGGLGELGRSGSYGRGAMGAGKGFAYSKLFEAMPHLEPYPQAKALGQKLANIGTDVAAVGSGTYAIERATGASHDQAMKAGLVNASALGVMRLTQIIPDLKPYTTEPAARFVGRVAVETKITPDWFRSRWANAGGFEHVVLREVTPMTGDQALTRPGEASPVEPTGRALSAYRDPSVPEQHKIAGTEIDAAKTPGYAERGIEVVDVTPDQYQQALRNINSINPTEPTQISAPPPPQPQIADTSTRGTYPRGEADMTAPERAQVEREARENMEHGTAAAQETSKAQALAALHRAKFADAETPVIDHLRQQAIERGASPEDIDNILKSGKGIDTTEAPVVAPSPETPRVPESKTALAAQVMAMMEGRGSRTAVIFTNAEPVPDLSDVPNIGQIRGPNGEQVIFRADKTTPAAAMKAMYEGRAHELTGMPNAEGANATVAAVVKGKDGKERWAGYLEPNNIEAFKTEAEAQFGKDYGPLSFDFGGQETEAKILKDRQGEADTEPSNRPNLPDATARKPAQSLPVEAAPVTASTPKASTSVSSEGAAPVVAPTPKELLDKYENSFGYTASDLANDLDSSSNDPRVERAVQKYREDEAYDRELKGRGDMDTAEDELLNAVRASVASPLVSEPKGKIAPFGTEEGPGSEQWKAVKEGRKPVATAGTPVNLVNGEPVNDVWQHIPAQAKAEGLFAVKLSANDPYNFVVAKDETTATRAAKELHAAGFETDDVDDAKVGKILGYSADDITAFAAHKQRILSSPAQGEAKEPAQSPLPEGQPKQRADARVGDVVEHEGQYHEVAGRSLREPKAKEVAARAGGVVVPEPANAKRFAVLKGTEYAKPETKQPDRGTKTAASGTKALPDGMAEFPAELGSLGIPRAAMPQIDNAHRGAMVQFLKGRGIDWTAEEVAPNTLKPSQLEYEPAKVERSRQFAADNADKEPRKILISEDNYVIDAHHQWLKDLEDEPSTPIPVLRLHAPANVIITELARFPSSGVDGTHHEASTKEPKASSEPTKYQPGAGVARLAGELADKRTGEDVELEPETKEKFKRLSQIKSWETKLKKEKEPPQSIILIACSGQKLETAAPAREIYQGDLFTKSRKYAEQQVDDQNADAFFILSAEHGLVDPNKKLKPYDRTLSKMNSAEREAWGVGVIDQIVREIPAESTLTLLAGNDYAEPIEKRLSSLGYKVARPLKGLGIGEQKAKLIAMLSPEATDKPELWDAKGRARRNAIDSYALENALSPEAQKALAQMFKTRQNLGQRYVREAMEVYHRLVEGEHGDIKDPQAAKAVRDATEAYFLDETPENAAKLQDAIWQGLQTLTGEEDPDLANLLENEVFASAEEAGQLIFDTLDPRTASFDTEEFNTAFGDVEFRRAEDNVFPAPPEQVNKHIEDPPPSKKDNYAPRPQDQTDPQISEAEAAKRLASWKAFAKRVGKEEDHSKEAIISLYDVTGIWSQPYVDAGYHVVRYDIKSGKDLMKFGDWMIDIEELISEGYRIVGVLAQPPCTTYTLSGTRWWKDRHDAENISEVEKLGGLWATEYFKRPIDYANTLVAVAKLVVQQADPEEFYAMENPVGRIDTQNHLPEFVLKFNPYVYGDPYTKQTQIWGDFNPNLPVANVHPSEGQKIHRLRGDVPEQKAERSKTPEGFAYAFFMANNTSKLQAQDGVETKKGKNQQRRKPIQYTRYEIGNETVVFARKVGEVKGDPLQQISASIPTGTYFFYEDKLYVRAPMAMVGGRVDYYGLLNIPAKGRPTFIEDEFHRGLRGRSSDAKANTLFTDALNYAETVRDRESADLMLDIASDTETRPEVKTHAVSQQLEAGGGKPEHPGTTPGTAVSADEGKPRRGRGEQTGSGDSPESGQEAAEVEGAPEPWVVPTQKQLRAVWEPTFDEARWWESDYAHSGEGADEENTAKFHDATIEGTVHEQRARLETIRELQAVLAGGVSLKTGRALTAKQTKELQDDLAELKGVYDGTWVELEMPYGTQAMENARRLVEGDNYDGRESAGGVTEGSAGQKETGQKGQTKAPRAEVAASLKETTQKALNALKRLAPGLAPKVLEKHARAIAEMVVSGTPDEKILKVGKNREAYQEITGPPRRTYAPKGEEPAPKPAAAPAATSDLKQSLADWAKRITELPKKPALAQLQGLFREGEQFGLKAGSRYHKLLDGLARAIKAADGKDGDIAAASNASIEDKVNKAVTYNGKQYAVSGGWFKGVESGHNGWELVPRAAFEGEVQSESDKKDHEARRKDPKGYYNGLPVRFKKQDYVLKGPPVEFRPGRPANAEVERVATASTNLRDIFDEELNAVFDEQPAVRAFAEKERVKSEEPKSNTAAETFRDDIAQRLIIAYAGQAKTAKHWTKRIRELGKEQAWKQLRRNIEQVVLDTDDPNDYLEGDDAKAYNANIDWITDQVFAVIPFSDAPDTAKVKKTITDRTPEGYGPSEPPSLDEIEQGLDDLFGDEPPKETKATEPEFQPELAIRIAADSVKGLTGAGVERVIHETPTKHRPAVVDYIKKARPDLAKRVDQALADETEDEAPQSAAKALEKKVAKPAAAAKPEKTNRTGLTKPQAAYVAKATEDYVNNLMAEAWGDEADKIRANWENELPAGNVDQKLGIDKKEPAPKTINVPDDGQFTVISAESANRLHQRVTGQPVPGFEKAKGAKVMQSSMTSHRRADTTPELGELITAFGDDEARTLDVLKRSLAAVDEDAPGYQAQKSLIEALVDRMKPAAVEPEPEELTEVAKLVANLSPREAVTTLDQLIEDTQRQRDALKALAGDRKKSTARKELDELDNKIFEAREVRSSKEAEVLAQGGPAETPEEVFTPEVLVETDRSEAPDHDLSYIYKFLIPSSVFGLRVGEFAAATTPKSEDGRVILSTGWHLTPERARKHLLYLLELGRTSPGSHAGAEEHERNAQPIRDAVNRYFDNLATETKTEAKPDAEPWQMTKSEYVNARVDELSEAKKANRDEVTLAVRRAVGKHEKLVKEAVDLGKTVPRDVLLDYNDLYDRYEQAAQYRIKETKERTKALLAAGKPEAVTRADFIGYHQTGWIPESAYGGYADVEGISWIGPKSKHPELVDSGQFDGETIEFRKGNEPLKYVATDADDEIIRDAQGLATYETDEEVKAKGWPLTETTIVAYNEQDQPIGWASDEFGADGIWVTDPYQSRGIGLRLLRLFKAQFKPERKMGQMTNGGVNLSTAYHRSLVKDALAAGKYVSPNVLADYPELNPSAQLARGPDFDEEKYRKAKPLFEAALTHFQKPGMTPADGVRGMVRHFAAKGWDKEKLGRMKPYVVEFIETLAPVKPEPKKKDKPTKKAPEDNFAGIQALAEKVIEALEGDWKIDNRALRELADKAFGGTSASGAYTIKDAYDGLELGLNHYLAVDAAKLLDSSAYSPTEALEHLRKIMAKLPRQTDRTEEMETYQQFSTPPTLSFAVAKAGNIKPEDIVVEPSAGTGNLAVWPMAVGATVHTNEISPRRQQILENLMQGQPAPTSVDGEILNDVLPLDIRPTLVLMNPPFSATAGRTVRNDTKYGAKHIESALQRLADGGRLVTISGEGMALNKDRFRTWWNRIAERYNVRANLSIPGDEYGKFGTTFGTQLIVIDKTGPTPGANPAERIANIKFGVMGSIEEALDELKSIIADRPVAQPATDVRDGRRKPKRPSRGGSKLRGSNGGRRPVQTPTAGSGESPDVVPNGEPGDTNDVRSDPDHTPISDGRGAPESIELADGIPAEAEPEFVPASLGLTQERNADIGKEEIGGTFVEYRPAKMTGGMRHPGDIVETASLAAVEPPDIHYTPHIPVEVIESGGLSDLQIETVSYVGQRHELFLPNHQRAGYFIGDGTGVGKGREIAAVGVDNWNQKRRRMVWISVSKDLIDAAKDDFDQVGGKNIPLRSLNDWNAADTIDLGDGCVFATYSTLISSAKKGNKQKRREQIEKWLGDEGIIVFDEGHKAKNLVAITGDPTQTGQAVFDLQENLPRARVVYASATGATEVRNMAYMTRLGLWGTGTAFPAGFNEFMTEIDRGGVGAMEMVARDMKAFGLFASRSLSYRGVEYREVFHELTPKQRAMYDATANAMQIILQNIEEALDITTATPWAKKMALAAFWGNHQRLFRQIITAFKIPTLIKDIDDALATEKSIVIDLVGTGESRTKDQVTKALAVGGSLEDLDFSPRETIAQMLDSAFPTDLYQEIADPNNPSNTIRVVVRDEEDNVVQSQAALEMKNQLLDQLSDLQLPENPLDQIVNHYGESEVAEITGRRRRLIRKKDGTVSYVKRAPEGISMDHTNLYEMAQFQDGDKHIAIISPAGGTGISLHASNRAKNQQQRVHIILEVGWSADAQLQKNGRTHRSDQAQPPRYDLLSSDVGGERRFSSTIAKRLASLGALTKAERKGTGAGDLAKYNFETEEGRAALSMFYTNIMRNPSTSVPGVANAQQALRDMGILKENPDGGEGIKTDDLTNITRFLNRLLALDLGRQNPFFEQFTRTFDDVVNYRKETGMFDEGVADVKADKVEVTDEPQVVHVDKMTGAKTLHYGLEVAHALDVMEFPAAEASITAEYSAGGQPAFFKQQRSGHFILARRVGSDTDPKTGRVMHKYRAWTPEKSYIITDNDFVKYDEATIDEARPWWEARAAAAPRYRTSDMHIISGAILPLWQKLKTEQWQTLRVIRLFTDDGQRILGVQIPNESVGKILRAIGVDRDVRTPEEIFNAVIEQGDRLQLSAGLWLIPARFRGEPTIEVKGVDYNKFSQMREFGLLNERIDYAQRFFVPSDIKRATPVLEALLEAYPVIDKAGPEEQTAQFARSKPDEDLTQFDRHYEKAILKEAVPISTDAENEKTLSIATQGSSRANSRIERRAQRLSASSELQNSNLPGLALSRTAEPMTLGMFSQLWRVVLDKMPARATTQHLRSILAAVKADELKWSGLDEFLAGKDSVDKASVLGFLRGNHLKIEESILTGKEAKFRQYVLPGKASNYRELLFILPGMRYRSFHFPEDEGVLAHARVDGRTVAGRKTLFVSEVQSDLQQDARSKGQKLTELPSNYSVEVKPEHPVVDVFIKRHYPSLPHLAESSFSLYTTVTPGEFKARREAGAWPERARNYDFQFTERLAPEEWIIKNESGQVEGQGSRLDAMSEALGAANRGRVPVAPYLKSWHQFVMRRLILKAVEGQYQTLAWITGEQAAELYDLSKHVDELSWTRSKENTYDLIASKDNEPISDNGDLNDIEPERLPEIVGKEIAQRIIAGEGIPHRRLSSSDEAGATLRGLDLKVGAGGMSGFYDKILPDYMRKLARKFGGSVSDLHLGDQIVHSVAITPQMRESLDLPLFARGAERDPWLGDEPQWETRGNRITLNRPGIAMVSDAYRDSPANYNIGPFGILGATERNPDSLASVLYDLGEADPTRTEPARQLARAVIKAGKAGIPIQLGIPEYIAHEGVHGVQHEASDHAAINEQLTPEGFDRLEARPQWAQLRGRLISKGERDNREALMAEAAAYLASGDLLGLSVDDAVAWLADYIDAFAEKNGQLSTKKFKELVYEFQRELDTLGRSITRAEETGRFAGRGAPDLPDQGSQGAKTAPQGKERDVHALGQGRESDTSAARQIDTPEQQTIADIDSRVASSKKFAAWLSDLLEGNKQEIASAMADDSLRQSYVEDFVGDEHSLQVRPDGLIEFYRLWNNDTRKIIGDNPVIVYHHTSDAILPTVRMEGLKRTDSTHNAYQNSKAGVYVSTETSGPAITGYHRSATSNLGGNEISLGIKATLDALTPDPDDADIASGATQYILPYVSPQDIVEIIRGGYAEPFDPSNPTILFARADEPDPFEELRRLAQPLSQPEGDWPTGIKNAVTDQERSDIGRGPVIIEARRDIPTVFQDAQNEFDPNEARIFAQSMATNPRPLMAEETAGMIIYKTWLKNQYAGVSRKLSAAQEAEDAPAQVDNRVRLAELDEELSIYQEMARRTGYEQGLGLRLRAEMMHQDYSLAELKMRAFAAGAGERDEDGRMKLPAELEQKLADLVAERDSAVEALRAYDDEARQRALEAELQKEKDRRRRQKQRARDEVKQRIKVVTRIVEKGKLSQEFDDLSTKLDNLIMSRFSANPFLDPELLRVLKQMGRNLVEQGANTTDEYVTPIWERVKGKISGASRQDLEDAISGRGRVILPSQAEIDARISELNRLLRDIGNVRDIQAGHRPPRTGFQPRKPTQRERESLKRVHAALRKYAAVIEANDPGARDEAQKSILDAAKTAVRNRIDDLDAYIAGRETPTQRRPSTVTDAELEWLRAERKRLQGIWDQMKEAKGLSDDEKIALATAAIQKSIDDYERRIAEGNLATRKKTVDPWSAELGRLQQRKQSLAKRLAEMRKQAKPPKTDIEKVMAAEAAAQRSIESLQQKIAVGGGPVKHKTVEPWSEELGRLRQAQAGLRDQLKQIRDNDLNRKLDSMKRYLDRRTEDLKEKLRTRQFVKTKPAPVQDPEVDKKRVKVKELEDRINTEIARIEYANRTGLQKSIDWAVAIRRAVAFSSSWVLGKLTNAAYARIFLHFSDEAVGGVASSLPLLKLVAARAPMEGRLSLPALSKMAQMAFGNEMRKFRHEQRVKALKTGKLDMDLMYGKKRASSISTIWPEYVGHVHMVMKTPAKLATFALAHQKNLEWFARYGYDPTDPGIDAMAAAHAVLTAERAILQNPNMVSDLVARIERAAAHEKTEAHPHGDPKALLAAGFIRMLFPTTRVPPNFVTEAFNRAFGVPVGVARAGINLAIHGGAPPRTPPPDLPPGSGTGGVDPWEGGIPRDIAESIMRQIKQGGTGFMMWFLAIASALGLWGVDHLIQFGGYYRKGAKRKEEDVPFGGIRIMGWDVPAWGTHVPLLEVGQLATTAIQVYQQYHNVGDDDESIPRAVIASGTGLLAEVPFWEEMGRATSAFESSGNASRYIGELGRGMVIPPDVFRMARTLDPVKPTSALDKFWNLTGFKRIQAMPRKPEGGFTSRVGQEFELALPGLRKRVGVDGEKQRTQTKDRLTDEFRALKSRLGEERFTSVLNAPMNDSREWNKLSREEQDAWTKATAQVVQGIQSGVILPGDADSIARNALLTPFQLRFKGKNVVEAMDQYEQMPPENQEMVRQLLIDKGSSIKSLRVPEQEAVAQRFRELTSQDPTARHRGGKKRMFKRMLNADQSSQDQ